MSDGITTLIIQRIQRTHQWFLDITAELTETQLAWIPSDTAPPIRWHFWHLARCADHFQANLLADAAALKQRLDPNSGIWQAEGLAVGWGLDPATLGWLETGAYQADDVARSMSLPAKDHLLGYGQRVFAAADQVVAGLEAHQLQADRQSIWVEREETVGWDVLFHLSHASRHLGMMEALRGAQGLRGTATS
jgi:hypothetical protein